MMYETFDAFRYAEHKRVTLIGMSNIGKTKLSRSLSGANWFHYSVDYRIATKHLHDSIIDSLKREMMRVPLLAAYLRAQAVDVALNVSSQNLDAVSQFLGRLGAPELGGLPLQEFVRRQRLHREAEIAAIAEMPSFTRRAEEIYGCPHFIMDTGGSFCEVLDSYDDEDPLLRAILANSVVLYIRPDAETEAGMIRNAQSQPKPLYYRPEFLAKNLELFVAETGKAVDTVDPNEFLSWCYPRLLAERRPRYETIARHGYEISASDAAAVRNEGDFVALVCRAINDRHASLTPQNAAGSDDDGTTAFENGVTVELYFGSAVGDGAKVSEEEWRDFVDREIAPRFPGGMTISDALGQWRKGDGSLAEERTKRLTLVLTRSAREDEAIEHIRRLYKQRFRQKSVLLVKHEGSVAF